MHCLKPQLIFFIITGFVSIFAAKVDGYHVLVVGCPCGNFVFSVVRTQHVFYVHMATFVLMLELM
jgi:hypothetical protein